MSHDHPASHLHNQQISNSGSQSRWSHVDRVSYLGKPLWPIRTLIGTISTGWFVCPILWWLFLSHNAGGQTSEGRSIYTRKSPSEIDRQKSNTTGVWNRKASGIKRLSACSLIIGEANDKVINPRAAPYYGITRTTRVCIEYIEFYIDE